MRLTVVGCSGSFPGPESAASCYLLEHDGFRLVLDLGNGALGPLQRVVDLSQVDAVWVSHLHLDHYVDLGPYYVARRYDPRGPQPLLPVYGPVGTAEQLAGAYGGSMALDHLLEVFTFTDVHPGVSEIGPFRVVAARMAHPVECHGVRLAADGVTVAYSGDTGPAEALVDLARGVDLLLAEASFRTGEPNPPDLHLTGWDAGEHAAAAEVGRLVVTHVPPWHSAERAVEEATGAFSGPVEAAVTGTSWVL